MGERENLFQLLKSNKQFRTLWIGQTISQLGDSINWMANLAFVTIIAPVIGTSILLLWLTIPIILFGTIAGMVADMFSRKALMLLADISRAIAILIFVLLLTNVISVKSDVQSLTYKENKISKNEYIIRESLSKNEKKDALKNVKITFKDNKNRIVEIIEEGFYTIEVEGNLETKKINVVVSTSNKDYEKIILEKVGDKDLYRGNIDLRIAKSSEKKNGIVEISAQEGNIEISYLEKKGPIFLIYVLTFILSFITQFYVPAKSALMPEIVDKEYLIYANSLSASTYKIIMIFGGALGGFIIGRFGVMSAFWIDFITYIISFSTILFIREKHFKKILEDRKADKEKKSLKKEILEGLKITSGKDIVKFSILRYIIVMAAGGIVYVFMINYSNETLQMGVEGAGYLQSSLGIGIVLGSFILGIIGNRISKLFLIKSGFLIVSVAIFSMAFITNIYVAFIAGVLGGIGSGFIIVLSETILQLVIPAQSRGTIFGILQTLTNAAFAIFAILTGVLLSSINEKFVFIITGLILIVFVFIEELYEFFKMRRGNGKIKNN